jgi:hypothetical protein
VTASWVTAWLLPIGAGICLAAACGFRTFVPLLCIGVAGRLGGFPLDASYAWLASGAGLVVLGTATVLEVAGYYVPLLDHALDVIATPLAMVAGTLAMFTSIGADHGLWGWLLALVAGGGLSGLVQLTTVKARLLSSATTGGLGNPFVATLELAGATVLSTIVLLVPVLAGVTALATLIALWWLRRRTRTRRMARAR